VESYFYDKRVAFYFFGYDVARLLVGSKEQLAMVTQISFKVMPNTYVGLTFVVFVVNVLRMIL
jgi:hypothetical protein